MKHNEYALLFTPTLHPMARNLYLAMRYCVDYQSGLVTVSYSKLRQLCSFEPPSKSKAEPFSPTVKHIRVWLSQLEKHELIEKAASGNAAKGESATWRLCQINKGTEQGHIETQQPRGLQAEQGHGTRAQEGHKKGTLQGHTQTQQPHGLESQQGHIGEPQQGHISVYTSVNKNKYISGDQFLTANDLEFGQEFKSVANMVGLQLNPEQLQAAFVQFTSHRNKRHLTQSKADWLADWRGWCAKAKVYEAGANNHAKPNTNTQRFSGFKRPQNSTAKVLDLARAHAARTAREDW